MEEKMRQKIITLFFILLVGAMASVHAQPRGTLFKVQAKGHTMYLFGTMHVGQPDFYPLEPRITQAVANAPALALEIDPLASQALMAQAAMRHGLLPPGSKTVADQPPAFRARLQKAFAGAGMNLEQFAQYKPWMMAIVLGMAEYFKQGTLPSLSVDMHLAQLAQNAKVPILELESVDLQMRLFDRMTPDEQWRFLDDTLVSIESGKHREETRALIAAWAKADHAALERLVKEMEADQSVSMRFVQNVLLDGRNGAIADKLMAMLEKSDGNVAGMGTLHLIGTNSVPALMKAKGATVERVY